LALSNNRSLTLTRASVGYIKEQLMSNTFQQKTWPPLEILIGMDEI
jgi:hypothetical protein